MFYKGTLKSYNPEVEAGIIRLSGQDIELHFNIKDFPNASLKPQMGERVKCLIEERQGQAFAKYIVRLDHKNARTEKPIQQGEAPQEESFNHESMQDHVSDTPLSSDQQHHLLGQDVHVDDGQIPQPNQQASSLESSNSTTTTQAKKRIFLIKPFQFKSQPQQKAEQKSFNNRHQTVSNVGSNESQSTMKLNDEKNSEIRRRAQINTQSYYNGNAAAYIHGSNAAVAAVSDHIDSVPIEKFDMRPVDLDVKGTIDLTKRFKTVNDPFEELYPTRSPAEKVKLAADPIDEFEQLQRQIRGSSDRMVTDHYTYNHDVNQKHSDDADASTDDQEASTSFRHKIRIKQPTSKFKLNRFKFNIPSYIVMSVVSITLLLILSYLGFQKYVKHKSEQDARAQYYLLEQQKAIEEQSKRMAELANKEKK